VIKLLNKLYDMRIEAEYLLEEAYGVEETKKEIIERLNEEMPYCNKGNCKYNWELNCITDDVEIRKKRVTQGNSDGQWCALCPCFTNGDHEWYSNGLDFNV